MKIFLCGYMGSGKTVISELLAKKLDFSFIDTDDHIELLEQLTVKEIFNSKGELYFRKRENQILEDVLQDPASLVISLGGGTPCFGNNLDIIINGENTRLIYLKASVEFLTDRLFTEKYTRPVISHLDEKEELEDFIRKHLFERGYYYNQANIKVDVEEKSLESIVDEIILKLE